MANSKRLQIGNEPCCCIEIDGCGELQPIGRNRHTRRHQTRTRLKRRALRRGPRTVMLPVPAPAYVRQSNSASAGKLAWRTTETGGHLQLVNRPKLRSQPAWVVDAGRPASSSFTRQPEGRPAVVASYMGLSGGQVVPLFADFLRRVGERTDKNLASLPAPRDTPASSENDRRVA